jgi:hypothetical protein
MALMEKDAEIFRLLCEAARRMIDYPGNAALAQKAGYQNPDSVTDSIIRLENAGHVRREGNPRRPSAIIILFSGKKLCIRYREEGRSFRRVRKFKIAPACGAICTEPEGAFSEGVDLMAVSASGGCRYPYGDQDYRFCGKPLRKLSSYCPEHHALCYISKQIVRPPEPDVRISLDDIAYEVIEREGVDGA